MRRSLFRVAGSVLWLGLLAACSLTQSLDGYSGGTDGVSCGTGEKECGGTCRSVRDQLFGCGGATCTPCAFTHAGVAGCDNAGACVLGPCANGFADCDGVVANGCEVETDTDPAHCGSCAKDCGSVASGVTACQGGVCQVRTCTAPLANCDGKFESGCAVDTSSDVAHCGACTTPCPTLAGTTFTCASSACKVSACADALIDCNGVVSDGCECGAPHAVAKCVVASADAGVSSDAGAVEDAGDGGMEAGGSAAPGTCVMSGDCKPGYANCNGNLAGDGCEITLASDKMNCGACGWNCNGVECSGGYCTPASIIDAQQRSFPRDAHRFGLLANFHHQVDADPIADAQFDSLATKRAKARKRRIEAVRAGKKTRQRIDTFVVADRGPGHVRGSVDGRHDHARNHGACGIFDKTIETCLSGLCGEDTGGNGEKGPECKSLGRHSLPPLESDGLP